MPNSDEAAGRGRWTGRPRLGRRLRRISWLVCLGLLAATSLWELKVVGFCVSHRLRYPFELSWMEGALVDHARRLAAGGSIYAPPSAEFVPLLYTPVSHHVASWLIRAGVDGFRATRLVSILSLVGATGVGMWLVTRATRHKLMSLLVPVLVAGTYFDVDAYYDVARPDNLMVLFCMLAVAALTASSAMIATPLFVIFASLAIFAKQPAAVFVAALLLGLATIRPRLALFGGLILLLVVATAFTWMDRTTEGWFHVYTVELPSYHGFIEGGLMKSLIDDLHGRFPAFTYVMLLSLVAVAWLRSGPRDPRDPRRRTFLVLLIALVGATPFTVLSRWHHGGAANVLALYAVLGAALLPAAVARAADALGPPVRRALGWRIAMLLLSVVVAMKIGGMEQIDRHVPTEYDARVWRRFRADLAEYGPPRRVWVPFHGAAVGALPGDPARPHATAIWDYIGGVYGIPTGRRLPNDLVNLIEERFFNVIVFKDRDTLIERLIQPAYRPATGQDAVDLPTFSGWSLGRESFWVPAEATSNESANTPAHSVIEQLDVP